jgi:hypothetical protein
MDQGDDGPPNELPTSIRSAGRGDPANRDRPASTEPDSRTTMAIPNSCSEGRMNFDKLPLGVASADMWVESSTSTLAFPRSLLVVARRGTSR